jgi:hypothetical protein
MYFGGPNKNKGQPGVLDSIKKDDIEIEIKNDF